MIRRLLELRRGQFAQDATMIQLASLVQAGTYLVTSVLTKRYLGLEDMGRWVSAREMFMVAYFFISMGLLNATVSRYSEAVGRQDRDGCVGALAAMLKIGTITSGLVLLAGFTLGPWAGRRIYDDPEVGTWAALLCISGVFEIVRALTVAALQGTRQMREYAWFDITTTSLRMFIVWGALAFGFGLPGVVGAFLLHMVVASSMSLWWYRKARDGHAKLAPPPLREVLAAVPRARVGHVFGIGYLLALNKSMSTLVPRLGMLIIPALGPVIASGSGFEDNAKYSIAYVMSWGLSLATAGITQTLLPALGLKLGSSEVPFDRLGGYLKRISLWTGTAMVALTLLSIGPVWLVIHYAYGADATDAFDYFLWLASGNLFIGFGVVVEAFYIYSGRLSFSVSLNFLLAALSVAGILWAGRVFGPIGVAAAAGLCRGLVLIHLVYIGVYFHRARARSAAT